MAQLVKKIENKCKSNNIFPRESLPGVLGVSRNQKLFMKYDFCSFEVSLEVLIKLIFKNHPKTNFFQVILWFFKFIDIEHKRTRVWKGFQNFTSVPERFFGLGKIYAPGHFNNMSGIIYSMVLNKHAARLLIFENFPTYTHSLGTYTFINFHKFFYLH